VLQCLKRSKACLSSWHLRNKPKYDLVYVLRLSPVTVKICFDFGMQYSVALVSPIYQASHVVSLRLLYAQAIHHCFALVFYTLPSHHLVHLVFLRQSHLQCLRVVFSLEHGLVICGKSYIPFLFAGVVTFYFITSRPLTLDLDLSIYLLNFSLHLQHCGCDCWVCFLGKSSLATVSTIHRYDFII